ncbi:putative cutinase [Xylariaceae sp. FL0804]|nr:putative cutinase [Xylariaceae sp. FL0804]
MQTFGVLATLALAASSVTAAPAPAAAARRDWFELNAFLAMVADVMPVNETVTDVGALIAAGDELLGAAFGFSDTENGSGGMCEEVTVLFARGTDEPGNVGDLVGPPLFRFLEPKLAAAGYSYSIMGVNYTASVENYLNGDASEGTTMADEITNIYSQCPDTKLVLGGYSQGGALVHNAAADLPASTMAKVAAITIFGDPDSSSAVAGIDASRVDIICHDGDNICEHGDVILLQHLTYAEDCDAASDFIMSNL